MSGRAGKEVRPAHASGTQVGTLHVGPHEFSVCREAPTWAASDGRPAFLRVSAIWSGVLMSASGTALASTAATMSRIRGLAAASGVRRHVRTLAADTHMRSEILRGVVAPREAAHRRTVAFVSIGMSPFRVNGGCALGARGSNVSLG